MKIEKNKCCGCSACVQICPQKCLKMEADEEGFSYPVTDASKCVHCGLCKKVCPILHKKQIRQPLHVYAVYNKCVEIRKNSSSGGAFSLIAQYVLSIGGVVFGASFDENWNVRHIGLNNSLDLYKLRGSKYVQSNIGKTYQEAETALKKGKLVLYTGTPCQIAGLKAFLRKDYANLYTIDVLCHGVPSPKIWKKYLSEVSDIKNIKDISFRDKRYGWSSYSFVLKQYDLNTITQKYTDNVFLTGFLNHLYIRPICHQCPFKSLKSESNITLGDFWKVGADDSRFGDDRGTSMVLINDLKGKQLWEQISPKFMFCVEKTYRQAKDVCGMIEKSCPINEKRSDFFTDIRKGLSVVKAVNKHVVKKNELMNRIRCILMPNRVLVDAPGQTCNRFWAYLDTIAWAIVYKKKVYVLFWDSSLKYFDALRDNPYVCFVFYRKCLFDKFGEQRVKTYVQKFFTQSLIKRFLNSRYVRKLGFLPSWPLRKSHQYFPIVKSDLRKIYKPNEDVCHSVERAIQKYKNNGYFVIGVHIRRGDYKEFEGGRYYFEYTDYRDMMFNLTKVFKEEKVAFFISTNEKYDSSIFKNFVLCEVGGNTVAHDLYALSLCDRIIGPLSTFSRWASWYGDVPLAFFDKSNMQLSKDSFSVISDFYHFMNGKEIINLSDK